MQLHLSSMQPCLTTRTDQRKLANKLLGHTFLLDPELKLPVKGHTEANLWVMVINKCWKNDAILRKIRESRWIRSLKTFWPSGMNLRTDGL